MNIIKKDYRDRQNAVSEYTYREVGLLTQRLIDYDHLVIPRLKELNLRTNSDVFEMVLSAGGTASLTADQSQGTKPRRRLTENSDLAAHITKNTLVGAPL